MAADLFAYQLKSRLVSDLQNLAGRPVQSQTNWIIVAEPSVPHRSVNAKEDAASSLTAKQIGILQPNLSPPTLEHARLINIENRLRAFRDNEIIRDFPSLDPERCILRDIMINKIIESRLDEPADFTRTYLKIA